MAPSSSRDIPWALPWQPLACTCCFWAELERVSEVLAEEHRAGIAENHVHPCSSPSWATNSEAASRLQRGFVLQFRVAPGRQRSFPRCICTWASVLECSQVQLGSLQEVGWQLAAASFLSAVRERHMATIPHRPLQAPLCRIRM